MVFWPESFVANKKVNNHSGGWAICAQLFLTHTLVCNCCGNTSPSVWIMDWNTELDILSAANCDTEILDAKKNIEDFIVDKIKARNAVGSEVPFWMANLDNVFEKHLRWKTNLPRVHPFYAVKCNNTPAVLKMLSALGTGFDCASKREIEMVMSYGVAPDRIIYAHATKPQSHIKYACAHGVDMMTFDCEEELLKIYTCYPKARLVLRIVADDSKSVVQLSTKFGAKLHTVGTLLEQAQTLGLEVIGVSFHVGCECPDSSVYRGAIADARHIFNKANSMGFEMSLLDIGGGFTGNEKFQKIAKGINEALDEYFPADSGVRIIAEPGRYFVDTAFTLAVNVFAKKKILREPTNNIQDVESADRLMLYYITDGVYGSFSPLITYLQPPTFFPKPHRKVESSEPRYQTIIWGPTCDSVDRITNTIWMPELHVGDWLLIYDFGAYSVSLSNDFNGFDKAIIYPVMTAQTENMLNFD